MIFWGRCNELANLEDGQLREWKRRGVNGFVCMVGPLAGVGGSQAFTVDPAVRPVGDEHQLQRALEQTRIARRAAQRGLKMYLGFYAFNRNNPATPWVPWFDDAQWNGLMLPRIRGLAAAARRLGFAGVAIDQEMYASDSGETTATWESNYPGHPENESRVRAMARVRGAQIMRTLVRAFPGVEVVAHATLLPESWLAHVLAQTGGSTLGDDLRIQFWDGMTSIRGYRAIRWWDATFYKSPDIEGATWHAAMQFNTNQVYSLLSRRFSNWAYAASRVHLSPFSWIDKGPESDEVAHPPPFVADQLRAFRTWGTGGEFGNFAYASLGAVNYAPYVPAMQAASRPAVVRRQAARPRSGAV